jgi:formylglycine-generating enzyme required for sulfatase activity
VGRGGDDLIDRSERLIPFWSDQDEVCRQLERLCGPGALDIRMLENNLQAVTWQRHGDLLGRWRPNPSAPLLVLGDLGCYGGEHDRARWLVTARRLHRDGLRVAALVPCSPLDPRWDRELARAWSAMPWERPALSSHALTGDERVHRLLRLVAPTFLAQPGLVRALRKLLPAAEADASTEVDVWQHPDVAAKDVTGLVLRASASERLRAVLASLPRSLLADVSALIERWHRDLPPELLHAETLAWRSWSATKPPGDPSTTKPPGNLERAKAFARRVAVTGWTVGGDDAEPGLARDYGGHLLGAVGDALYQEEPALKKLWIVTRAHLPGERRPATIAAHEVRGPLRGAVRWWALHQRGDALIFVPAVTGAWPGPGPGSPLATFTAAELRVWVRRGDERRPLPTALEQGAAIRLQPGERLVLDTDQGGEVTLGVWERAPWAVAAGRDRYGLWAAFEVRGVQQRMRWIPPGRFLMGSPPSEAGRWEDEGPQHWVTITKGYWLGETPVTQALWRAVMTNNPSRFVSDDRPVEQVSWEDCEKFIGRLNRQLEGLETRLPTEAEWARACRAGTTAATWVGDLTMRDENDAPELDAIAWYGGNSGVEFELDNGYDSSDWPGKQYPHTKAGTHPVGRKAPNPYGLHDMLGNVLEWCQDAAEDYRGPPYTSEPAVDPVSPEQGPAPCLPRRVVERLREDRACGVPLRALARRPLRPPRLPAGWRSGDCAQQARQAGKGAAERRPRTWRGTRRRPAEMLRRRRARNASRRPRRRKTHEVPLRGDPGPRRRGCRAGAQCVPRLAPGAQHRTAPDRRCAQSVWAICVTYTDASSPAPSGPGASRGGLGRKERIDYREILDEAAFARYQGNSDRETHPVGRKAPNPYGLHDMLGNVWEWCADSMRRYAADPVTDPVGDSQLPSRLYRGGSWSSSARIVRAARRFASPRGSRDDYLGFRLAGGQESALR